MNRLFVKICGVTTVRDAVHAVNLGADAIGLNFYSKSPRCISINRAKTIVAALPPFIWIVGIFVNETQRSIENICRAVKLDVAQLHGTESPTFARKLKMRTMKAIAVRDASIDVVAHRYANADAIVLDAAQSGFGGGGITFDWRLARRVAKKQPVLLAGGLTPENVAEAVRQVRPFGVDVASGVEKKPGEKDLKKMAAFIAAARSAV